MDSFETPYEEDSECIECTVCEKSFNGDTLYKFHLTSPGHLKKEDSLVSQVLIPLLPIRKIYLYQRVKPVIRKQQLVQYEYLKDSSIWAGVAYRRGVSWSGILHRKRAVPKFKDILHCMDYMQFDEPIIGLNYVEEVSVDSRNEPQYTCLLCRQNAKLVEMVRHLIGRKHRQKYLETKRPDLVTWDKQGQATQSGKVIRARAEIVERQDGRGCPVLLPVNKRNKPNLPAQSEPTFFNFNLPRLMELNFDPKKQNVCPSESGNTPLVRLKDSYTASRDVRDENPVSRDRHVGDPQRADYRDSDVERGKRDYMEPQFQSNVKEFGQNEFELRTEPSIVQDGDSLYARTYTERGPVDEFYSKEIRGEEIRAAEYQFPERFYPEADSHRQPLESELHRRVGMNGSERQGTSEPESSYRDFTSSAQGDRPYHVKVTIQDYGHKSKQMHHDGYSSDAGPSGRTGVSISHRPTEVSRCVADIPEPFKRFLSGPAVKTDQGKRKRKSRFSDASAEEIERAKTTFRDEYRPPKPKLAHCTQLARPLVPHRTESYQKGGSDSGPVFDLLSNIEIDNVEEADFLKNKLCDLLKEFKAKKREKAGQQNPPSQETLIKEYNQFSATVDPSTPQYDRQYNQFSATVSSSPTPQYERQHNQFSATVGSSPTPQYERQYNQFSAAADSPPKPLYERHRLSDLDSISPVHYEIQDDSTERGWTHANNMAERPRQEFLLPAREKVEHASSIRSLYEGVFGRHDMAASSRGYSENVQEPFPTYRPTAVDDVEIPSSAPRPNTPQEKVRYPKNLEKITSTLLELVGDHRFKFGFPNF